MRYMDFNGCRLREGGGGSGRLAFVRQGLSAEWWAFGGFVCAWCFVKVWFRLEGSGL